MSDVDALLFRRSRGMRDLLPGPMRVFRRVEDAFRAASGRWGYEEIRTPTLETYSLFTVAGGLTPEALSRVYTFLDWDGWSGERVVLRPDSTIPAARAAVEASLPLPARLSYVQARFRFAEAGESEEWQCGLEFLGAPELTGDVEVATVACETLEALAIKPTVRLAHVGVMAAVRALGDGDDGGTDLAKAAAALPAGSPARPFLEAALRPSEGAHLARNLRSLAEAGLPGALPALEELDWLAGALAKSGRRVVIDLAMPVDFEYYTGLVYEFESGTRRLGSGGRYAPSWTGMAGTACGVALGMGVLAEATAGQARGRRGVSVVASSGADYARAIEVAGALHRNGIPASLDGVPSGPVAVRVSGDRLVAETPDGERPIDSLEDLVTLLIQAK